MSQDNNSIPRADLELLKKELLDVPDQNFLMKGEIDPRPFELFSQLPVTPDRDKWWMQVRQVMGLQLILWRDLLTEVRNERQQTRDQLEKVIDILDTLLEDRESGLLHDTLTEEELRQDNNPMVEKSSWDPFKNE